MALWKDQSPSKTVLSFRQDGVIYEIEMRDVPTIDLPYRLTVGNLFCFKSSQWFMTLSGPCLLANKLVNAETDKERRQIVDKEFGL